MVNSHAFCSLLSGIDSISPEHHVAEKNVAFQMQRNIQAYKQVTINSSRNIKKRDTIETIKMSLLLILLIVSSYRKESRLIGSNKILILPKR